MTCFFIQRVANKYLLPAGSFNVRDTKGSDMWYLFSGSPRLSGGWQSVIWRVQWRRCKPSAIVVPRRIHSDLRSEEGSLEKEPFKFHLEEWLEHWQAEMKERDLPVLYLKIIGKSSALDGSVGAGEVGDVYRGLLGPGGRKKKQKRELRLGR